MVLDNGRIDRRGISEIDGVWLTRSSDKGLTWSSPERVNFAPMRNARRYQARLVLVVGATRENRAEALRSLRTELLIVGPLALVLATILGYLLAGTGLRAVDSMRRRAAAISADRAHERLPVPRTGDELQQLGETLNAMLDRLDRALERERGFVAEAGHELRTPLALLRAELDYALHYATTEDELRAQLETASQETDISKSRMLRITVRRLTAVPGSSELLERMTTIWMPTVVPVIGTNPNRRILRSTTCGPTDASSGTSTVGVWR